jgi:hypothetical protein
MRYHFVGIALMLSGPHLSRGEEPLCFQEKNAVFLRLAIKLDCYFTIEEQDDDYFRSTPKNRIYSRCFSSLAAQHHDLDAFLVELNRNLKGAKAMRQGPSSRIVHIIEDSLLRDSRHPLNSNRSLDYQGSPSGMLDELEKSVRLSRAKIGSFGLGIVNADVDTRISVKANNKGLRSILTDYLPLSEYNRLLWVAMARSDFSETWVRYKAKAPDFIHLSQMRSLEATDFSEGEAAYFANRHRPGANEAARNFVAKRMKEKNPHQVRWAMFFLGFQRDVTAIPLLIEHIDYFYTPGALLEEAYPAVKALTLLGRRTSLSALEAIETTDSDLRIKLLSKVIVNVEGLAEAGQLFTRRIQETLDPKIRQRLEKAHAWK